MIESDMRNVSVSGAHGYFQLRRSWGVKLPLPDSYSAQKQIVFERYKHLNMCSCSDLYVYHFSPVIFYKKVLSGLAVTKNKPLDTNNDNYLEFDEVKAFYNKRKKCSNKFQQKAN